jgi:RHS repeat-associated protein
MNANGYVDHVTGMDSSGILRLSQQHKYDPLGRLKEASMRVILPDGSSGPTVWTRTAHDIIGRPVKIVDGSGATTNINWNPDGTLSTVQDPDGNLTRYTWNAVGYLQRIEQVLPVAGGSSLSLAQDFTTDSLGRITSITDGLGNTEFYDYNSRSLLTKIIRADGVGEERVYDLAGRLISRSIPWPSTNSPLTGLHYTYDDSGELISVRDPDGCTIHYDRDERGDVERIVAADGAVLAHFVLDGLGRIRETTDARGTRVSNAWDGLGRLTTRRVMHAGGSAGITSETFSYDFYGNIIRAQNDHHVFTAEFDSLNRCYSEGVDGDLVRYTYGPNLDLAALTYPSGASVRYTRDNLGRVSAVNFVPIGAPSASISISWLGADRVAEMDHGNGLRTKFTYDRAGRLLQLKTLATSGPVEVLTFLRDPLFQLQLRHRMNEQVRAYSYDSGGQIRHIGQTAAGATPDVTAWSLGGNGDQVGLSGLAASFDPAISVQYALTPGGDRTSVAEPGGTALYTQGPAHRYLNAGEANLTWDANGNLIADDNYRYSYDHCNRLTTLADVTGNALFSMTYDPIGRLRSIIRQNGAEIRQHVGLEVVEEATPAGVRTFCPAFGVDQALAFAQGNNLYHIHRDQTWSVTALSSADGEVVERYTWGEFGELQGVYDRAFVPVNSPPTLARFQGRPQLADGILDYRQRILLSHLGRFAQVDPAGLEGDSNPYRFANNNPLLFVDPTGELFWIPIALGALIGGGIAAIANRNKSGADFWSSIIAGALGGAVAGSGLGIAGFAAGGAVSGIITGAYDGGKYGGVSSALTSGALGGLSGAAAGALGGTVGAKVSTGVTGAIYSSLTRGALRNVGRQAMGDAGRFIAASYTGTVTGGVSGGGTAGFSGGVVLGTGAMIANGQDVGESFLTGLESGYSGALDGAFYGGLGGPAFKALHQSLLTVATRHPFHTFKTLNQVIGEEAEFFVRNQIGNSKATFRTPQGSQPDLWGDALPWARPVYGDVKNTAAIPGLNKQHGQLRNIFNSIPNRFHPVNNPGGNRMSIFHRPGIQLPGTRHSMATQLASGEIVLTETLQFVFVTNSYLCLAAESHSNLIRKQLPR